VTQSGKDELSRKTHLPPTSNLLHRPTIPNTSLTCSVHFQLFRTAAAEYYRLLKPSLDPRRTFSVKMGKLTSTIGIPIKLLNEAQVRYIPSNRS
jgi:hypothetical protein